MYSDYTTFSVGEHVKLKKIFTRHRGVVIETIDPVFQHGNMIIGQYIKVKWDNPDYGETDYLPANQFTEA